MFNALNSVLLYLLQNITYSLSDSNFEFISPPSTTINKKSTVSFDFETITPNPYLVEVLAFNNIPVVGN